MATASLTWRRSVFFDDIGGINRAVVYVLFLKSFRAANSIQKIGSGVGARTNLNGDESGTGQAPSADWDGIESKFWRTARIKMTPAEVPKLPTRRLNLFIADRHCCQCHSECSLAAGVMRRPVGGLGKYGATRAKTSCCDAEKPPD
jgi:hypothetical protein